MASSLKLRHAAKYSELARLLLAHREPLTAEDAAADKDAAELTETLQAMGPTYVKLGQLLSSRVDLLPSAYTSALSRLQDQVEPMADGQGRAIVEEELGVRVTRAFASFDETPFAAASLAQVHRATMHDGRQVVVKVQRSGVRRQISDDMEVITELAGTLSDHWPLAERIGLPEAVREFHRSLMAELDYKAEAANLELFAKMLERYEHLVVPAPIGSFTTSRVLTMEYVNGRNLSAMGPLGLLELDGRPLAEELFRSYLDQILVHGLFHADPHPGNLLVTDDGKIGIVDLGMVARVAPELQDGLLRLLVAASEARGAEAAQALERIGTPLEEYDQLSFSRAVSDLVLRTQGADLAQLPIGEVVGQLARIGAESALRPPPELTMIGKALLNLDDVARRLDEKFRPADVVRAQVTSIMRHKMIQASSPANLVSAALDAKEFAEQLPGRMNRVLDSLASGDFTLNVEGVDESELMRGVQKLANRGAAGVVIAALVLSSAVFSLSTHGPRLFGESAFTIVLLAIAFLVALFVLGGTLRSDLPQHRRRH
jgi:ubiquinone biosynthesis protein